MHLVFVASEVAPFAKTGGLGDVAGALPLALAEQGHHVTVFMPLYASVGTRATYTGKTFDVFGHVAGRPISGTAREVESGNTNVRIFLLEQPGFFNRSGLYSTPRGDDYSDNCARFTWFCRATMDALERLELPVDCLHAHDWQAGLIPVLLQEEYRFKVPFLNAKSIFTIHNLAFQGIFDARDWYVTGLRRDLFTTQGLEYYSKFSLLKGALLFADQITTVSQTYAEEIKGPEFGHGMEGILLERADDLSGIVNGIDYVSWDPQTDSTLAANYDKTTWKTGKAQCKRWLRDKLWLAHRDCPLIGLVGRLTDQKGMDLLEKIGRSLLGLDVQLVVLGTGSAEYEGFLQRLSRQHAGQFACVIGFDEVLARQIYAGADMFLMPSRFEPCGLSQLYSLRYGTIPIVRAVGGLADTVTDASPLNLQAGTATGFQFQHYSPLAFLSAIRRALEVYQQSRWDQMVEFAMGQDWSWTKSALRYSSLYKRCRSLVGTRQTPIRGKGL